MRLPRVRFTVRRMMIGVAVVALGLAIAEEFQDGIPPRFVVRRIPGRIAQLRPGMTKAQTHEVLGLNRPWIWGGLGATPGCDWSMAMTSYFSYYVGKSRVVVWQDRQSGVRRGTLSTRVIELRFRQTPPSSLFNEDLSDPLVGASFRADGRTIAEMPGSR